MTGVDWGTLLTAIVALLGAITAHYRVTVSKRKTP